MRVRDWMTDKTREIDKKTYIDIRNIGKKAAALALAAVLGLSLAACGTKEQKLQVVLTTGAQEESAVFRLDDKICTRPEMQLYLTTARNRYEKVYGPEIWEAGENGAILEQMLREDVLAEVSQVKAMALMAEEQEVALTKQEEADLTAAAEEFMQTLTEEEAQLYKADADKIASMYREYLLADHVYRRIVQEVNPEISDDEARTITVQYLFFSTETEEGAEPMSAEARAEVYQRASQAREAAAGGITLERLKDRFGADDAGTMSYGKGEVETALETEGFELGKGELSPVVETTKGYYILRCVSTFNREETDRSKGKIAAMRKDEAFSQAYDTFLENVTQSFNKDVWEQLRPADREVSDTTEFFEIYDKYFGEETNGR